MLATRIVPMDLAEIAFHNGRHVRIQLDSGIRYDGYLSVVGDQIEQEIDGAPRVFNPVSGKREPPTIRFSSEEILNIERILDSRNDEEDELEAY